MFFPDGDGFLQHGEEALQSRRWRGQGRFLTPDGLSQKSVT
jgi:hypothetical protein